LASEGTEMIREREGGFLKNGMKIKGKVFAPKFECLLCQMKMKLYPRKKVLLISNDASRQT
jgi:hypothetical protein